MRGLKNPKTKERSDETIVIDLPKGTMMSSSRQLEDAVDAADSDNSLYGSANNTSIYETSSGGSGSGTTYDMDATPEEMSSYFVVFFFLRFDLQSWTFQQQDGGEVLSIYHLLQQADVNDI